MTAECDIAIVGAGPVGSALAISLKGSGLGVHVIDTRGAGTDVDPVRTIALAHGSRLILERLGLWARLDELTPIHTVIVTQRGSFGRTQIEAADMGVPALGYVTPYARLYRALRARLSECEARVMADCKVTGVQPAADAVVLSLESAGASAQLAARLAVVADGGEHGELAPLVTRDYRQSAIACEVATEVPHRNRAFERFTPDGPVALLPSGERSSLVWTAPHALVQALAALPEAEFLSRLNSAFGTALGAFTAATSRSVYPLSLRYARRPTAPRAILIGNAAQVLHPVAGQGFNLGLRDAWELGRVLAGTRDPGTRALLERYNSRRTIDRRGAISFTDALIRLFSNDMPILRGGRGIGLAALDLLPSAKRVLARRMMFGVRG